MRDKVAKLEQELHPIWVPDEVEIEAEEVLSKEMYSSINISNGDRLLIYHAMKEYALLACIEQKKICDSKLITSCQCDGWESCQNNLDEQSALIAPFPDFN